MKLYIVAMSLFIGLCLTGCEHRDKPVIKIKNVRISSDEFDAAFKKSPYVKNAVNGKEKFLDTFVDKKIILLEAERLGLDKDPALLEDLQIFWEQALLKSVLNYENKELASTVKVSDEEMENYFNEKIKPKFPNRIFAETKESLRSMIQKEKQQELILGWIKNLKEKTPVDIDYQQLNIKSMEGR